MSVPTLIKQPSESRLYTMEFAANLSVGETITSINSAVAEPAGLTLSGAAVPSGTQVHQRILGGTAGVVYKVTIVVTTSNNNILEGEGYLRVMEL
jgi:hypothetical protein